MTKELPSGLAEAGTLADAASIRDRDVPRPRGRVSPRVGPCRKSLAAIDAIFSRDHA